MMASIPVTFYLLIAVLYVAKETTGQVLIENENAGFNGNNNKFLPDLNGRNSNFGQPRVRRQDANSTTPKPKKHRPSNIFNLISVLVTETREDANRAFSEIGTLFNSQFVNATTNSTMTTTTTTTTTTVASPSSSNETTEEEEVSSTTEPFRITRNEFLGVLRSNVQGLVNLFGKEFRVAIKDSNNNVKEFGRGLRKAFSSLFS